MKLCNYFQIAYGEGIDEQFTFNLNHFCVKYNFPAAKTFNGLQFLDRQGIISLSQEFSEKITMQFLIPSKEVIRYISLNTNDEPILLSILRTYPGIYEMPTALNPQLIAKKSNTDLAEVQKLLKKLQEKAIIDLHSKNNDSTLIFNEIREDEKTINRVSKYLEKQNELKISQLRSVLKYVRDKKHCKSRSILEYFGETNTEDCGICSYCITKIPKKLDTKSVIERIVNLLQAEDLTSRDIEKITHFEAADVIFALKLLLENEAITIKSNNEYTLVK